MSLLDLLGLTRLFHNGTELRPTRKAINFVGGTVTDDALNERVDVHLADGGGGGDGTVTGPVSSTTGHVATFHGTDGTELDDSGVAITSLASKAYADSSSAAALASAHTYADAGDASTLTAAEAYTDAHAGGGWQVAVDSNFTQATPGAVVDGVQTIAGHSYTGSGIAAGATSAAVSSSGLVIANSTANTDFFAGARSAPMVVGKLSDLVPTFSSGTHDLRVYALLESNASNNYEHARLTLETIPNTVNVRSFWSASLGYAGGGELSMEQCRTTTVTQLPVQTGTVTRRAVCLLRKANGQVFYYSRDVSSHADTDTNDQVFGTDLSAWTLDAVSDPALSLLVAGSGTLVSGPASLAIVFSSQTVNTSGTHRGALKRLRVQHKS